jgi:uncharacterized membrane protein YuzA (DUF378 family)
VLAFLAVVLPWPLALTAHGAGHSAWTWLLPDVASSDALPLGRFVVQQLAWWFPGVALVLPGIVLAPRKILRLHEFDVADALPLCWIAIGIIPLLFMPGRENHQTIAMWSALALWIACAWDRTPPRLRIVGLGLVAALVFGAIGFTLSNAWPAFFRGAAAWNAVRWIIVGMSGVFLVAIAGAIYFAVRERATLAISIVYLAMVAVGLSVAEGMVRFDAHFSLARAAAFLERRLGADGEVLYEGQPTAGSSLRFYLDRGVAVMNAPSALERFAAAHPVFLIISKERVPFWQEQLTERFHFYHQETTCGEHVVLSNQP